MASETTGLESASSTRGGAAEASGPRACRIELALLGSGAVRERADAIRNRSRVLDAAAHLFARDGVGGVTMDEVAAEAGVGKGTLYRRFGDKAGLAVALLDDRERDLQQLILTGPTPLGPGGSPSGRLAAFVRAYVELVTANADLIVMSQTSSPGARLHTGSHRFWVQHCRYLLELAGAEQPALRAEFLLAGLTGEQIRHWLNEAGRNPDVLADTLADAAVALTT